ncbi:M20/M25/M40 family metallo-hydrolase, partial [Silvibacterium sp.]|uniref:M20/M25/M40 family metallo-hydrolase n=1 Tax=Silvibacterium sp. TaxID=1964179 RepID=UPI0039E605A1
PGRRDALCAASELTLAIEAAALNSGAIDTVATVGVCRVHPGAVNSIPSRVELMLDLRDTDEDRRNRVYSHIRTTASEIAHRRRVAIRFEPINADRPAASDPAILAALEEAAQAEQLPFRRIVSRAYHDALFMARIAPVAMLFLPCRGGVSHRPDEHAEPEHIAQATRTLARTLATLSAK